MVFSLSLVNGITSLTRKQVAPEQLLQIRRAHWGIKTDLHYRRDVTLKEDDTRMMVKAMALINNLILALIRQAGFHNAAQARRWSHLIFPGHLPSSPRPFLDFKKAISDRSGIGKKIR